MQELLAENIRLTREMHGVVKALHRQMVWGRVKFFIKLAVLAALIYIGYATLPSFLEKSLAPYQSTLQQLNQFPALLQQLQNVSKINLPPELKKLLPPSK